MARDIEIPRGTVQLERGCDMADDIVRGRLYGNPDGPLLIVLGGISATRFVADGGKLDRGWWSRLVRKGGPIDLNRFQVLGIDFAPGKGGLIALKPLQPLTKPNVLLIY